MEQCVYDFNSSQHLAVEDSTPGAEAEAEKAEERATVELPNRMLAVENAIVSLQDSFDRDLKTLRETRQRLDDLLASRRAG